MGDEEKVLELLIRSEEVEIGAGYYNQEPVTI